MAAITGANLEKLRQWFIQNDGHIHPAVQLRSSDSDCTRGSYIAATDAVPTGSDMLAVPLDLTLSILNIPTVAPFWPLSFLDKFAAEPHVLTRFLIVEAWLQGEKCFWWPYLQAVPQPSERIDGGCSPVESDPFDTPLYWTSEERAWLKGTRLGALAESRERMWKSEHLSGVEFLKSQVLGSDQAGEWEKVQPTRWMGYSWERYKWAATVLTSRSFSSLTLEGWRPSCLITEAPRESRLGKDLAASIERQTFPVLFPVLDTANHSPSLQSSWRKEEGNCVLRAEQLFDAGAEICINYDANGNDTLIMGYGFMLDRNDHDRVHLSAGEASIDVEDDRKTALPGQEGLKLETKFEGLAQVCSILINALTPAEAIRLTLQLVNKREAAEFSSTAGRNRSTERRGLLELLAQPEHRRIVFMLADKVNLGLRDYRERLRAALPSDLEQSRRSNIARDFRQGQVKIVDSNSRLLEQFLNCGRLSNGMISVSALLDSRGAPDITRALLYLLEIACGAEPNESRVWEADLHELTFTIWICLVWLKHSGEPTEHSPTAQWIKQLEVAYGDPRSAREAESDEQGTPNNEDDENAAMVQSYLEVLQYAADATSRGLIFSEPAWTVDFLRWGLEVFQQESLFMESHIHHLSTAEGMQDKELLFWKPQIR